MDTFKLLGALLLLLTAIISEVSSAAIQLTSKNYEEELKKHKVMLVNFYAEWCRFSQMLQPTFDQAADIVKEEFPDAALAKVDAEAETDIAQKNFITKYPTLKIFRFGVPMRKEYRGQRSVDAFSNFIRNQMKNPIKEFHSREDFKVDFNKNTIIAYFDSRGSENYKVFDKVADALRDDCDFVVGFGDAVDKERAHGDNVVFRAQHTNGDVDVPYQSSLTAEDELKTWATSKCIPLVREITFENGEELTEEGLPFLLLFHLPTDIDSLKRFKLAVERELPHEKGNINFLNADGTKFSHPLHHLEKSEKDLPLIAIDSFRHMYLFPKFDDIDVPGKLSQFVADLHSGKLHREFHNGPDPTQPQLIEDKSGSITADPSQQPHQPVDTQDAEMKTETVAESKDDNAAEDINEGHDSNEHEGKQRQESGSGSGRGPKETVFDKLRPSENRYTLLRYRDEL